MILKGVGIVLLFVSGVTVTLLFRGVPSRQPFDVALGDISPEDIRAPHAVTYVSELETQIARENAGASVADVYDPPDPRVGRQQVRRAHQILDYFSDVRADPLAENGLKVTYLGQVSGLAIPTDQAQTILSINDDQFQQLNRQTVGLLEEAMSGVVREGRVQDVVRGLELKISSDFPESLIPVTLNLAGRLVEPNSILDQTATDSARSQAMTAVPEVRHSYQVGEIIVRAGEPVDELDLEALNALGLANRETRWEDILDAVLVSVLGTSVLVIYLLAIRPAWAANLSHVRLVAGLYLMFLLSAQFLVSGQQPIAYLFPAAALAMVVSVLAGVEFAALTSVVMGGMVGVMAGGSLELAAYAAVGGLLAAGTLRQRARLAAFFQSGVTAAIGGSAVLLIFRLPSQVAAPDMPLLLGISVLNGALSTGATLVILLAIGGLTSLVTGLQLIDLMRADHPLQRRLQQEALGTYQHTLSVVNLVEAASEAIHADALLARVGTLYHDIGKLANPGFFIENRIDGGISPHDNLPAETSAQIILAHVNDGLDLAKKHRLPQQIIAFISEHHGTLPILYFLEKAKKDAEQTGSHVDEHDFTYSGPIPQSRETAILMMADGCESAVRANRPPTVEEMEDVINRIVQLRVDLHQLDNSGLTFNDILAIKQSFLRTLRGMYHPRIKYPGDDQPPAAQGQSVGASRI